MRCAPPRGYAQPSPACACAARNSPDAAAPTEGSGVFAWASTPASSASASSVANVHRPSARAELQRAQPEADRRDRMPRNAQQLRPGEVDERCRGGSSSGRMTARHARPSRPSPSAVRSRSRQAIAARAAVERLRVRDLGRDPLDALAQAEGAEEGRAQRRGVDRGADVVAESREGELRRAHAAADGVGGLEDPHLVSRAGEGDRGGEPVGSAADDRRLLSPWPHPATGPRRPAGAVQETRVRASGTCETRTARTVTACQSGAVQETRIPASGTCETRTAPNSDRMSEWLGPERVMPAAGTCEPGPRRTVTDARRRSRTDARRPGNPTGVSPRRARAAPPSARRATPARSRPRAPASRRAATASRRPTPSGRSGSPTA